jgi:hypothetical protein
MDDAERLIDLMTTEIVRKFILWTRAKINFENSTSPWVLRKNIQHSQLSIGFVKFKKCDDLIFKKSNTTPKRKLKLNEWK